MTNVRGDWPPLEGIEWPKNYAVLADYELDENGAPVAVKVLNPEEAHQPRRALSVDLPPVEIDDGTRLDTPENHRALTLADITDAVTGATNQAGIARKWSAENGYHPEVAKRLAEIVRDLRLVAELIDTHEKNR